MSEKLLFTELENGNLRISAENKADFKQFIDDHSNDMLTSFQPNSDQAFMELTEDYWTNGWGVFTADQLGQLSECLIVAKEATIEDDGSYTLYDRAWSNIADYQIVSPLTLILENGYYDFELWEEFKGENFPNPFMVEQENQQ